jgi:hypothetical protein
LQSSLANCWIVLAGCIRNTWQSRSDPALLSINRGDQHAERTLFAAKLAYQKWKLDRTIVIDKFAADNPTGSLAAAEY